MQSAHVARLLERAGREDTDRLWAELTAAGTPLMERQDDGRTLVTFLWRGEAETVRAYWTFDVPLTRAPHTDIWYGSELFPSDLRTLYGFVLNGARSMPVERDEESPAQLDHTNPRTAYFPVDPDDPTDEGGWASILELPDAPTSPWTTLRPGIPAGSLTTAALRPDITITAYLPYDVDPAGLPVLVVFDGYLAQTLMRIPTVLDNLIAAGRIPPMAALFVRGRAGNRLHDLNPGPAIEQLVAGELLPWARDRWEVGSPTGGNIVAGMSRGGLVAAHLGLARPDLFRGVVAHSASFWWPTADEGEPESLIREAAATADPAVRWFVDVGLMETTTGPGGARPQLAVCRDMRDALRGRGCDVTYLEFSGGHDYVSWRRDFPEALLALTR